MREDRLAGLETPGGIRGGPAAVDAEDAPNGDSVSDKGSIKVQGLYGRQFFRQGYILFTILIY